MKQKLTSLNGEKLFFFAYTVSLFVSFVISTTFMQYIPVRYLNWINYMLMLILLLKILVFDNFKLWQLGLMSLIMILAIYSWRKSQITSLMIMVAYILSAKNIEFTKIVKRYFDVNFVMLIGVSIYSLLGIIKNLGFERNGIVRQALGIDYPTDLAAYVLYLALAYCFLKYDHLRWYNYFGLSLIHISEPTRPY